MKKIVGVCVLMLICVICLRAFVSVDPVTKHTSSGEAGSNDVSLIVVEGLRSSGEWEVLNAYHSNDETELDIPSPNEMKEYNIVKWRLRYANLPILLEEKEI